MLERLTHCTQHKNDPHNATITTIRFKHIFTPYSKMHAQNIDVSVVSTLVVTLTYCFFTLN